MVSESFVVSLGTGLLLHPPFLILCTIRLASHAGLDLDQL